MNNVEELKLATLSWVHWFAERAVAPTSVASAPCGYPPSSFRNKGSIHSALWGSNVYGLATTQCLASLRLQGVSPSTRVRMTLPHDVAAENSRNYVSHPHTNFRDINVSCKTQRRRQWAN